MFVNVTATEKFYTQADNRDDPQCIGGKYPPILMRYNDNIIACSSTLTKKCQNFSYFILFHILKS